MAAQPLTGALMQEALDAFAATSGNITAAAISLGLSRTTYRHRLDKAHASGITPRQPSVKPRIRVPARSVYKPVPEEFGNAIRVMVFGCAHDATDIPDKVRFANAGRLACRLRPDFVVDLGDTLDLDSLSRFAAPGSQDDRDRPFFRAEMDSLTAALSAFREHGPDPDEIPHYHLHGNHEYRAARYEAANPMAQGVFTTALDQVYARFGWTVKPYREWLFLDGVGFIHAPINGVGKEVAGKFPDQIIAQETTFSVVWSHTHKNVLVNRPKFGIGNSLRVYNTGSFMPQGYVKSYAGLAMTGWTYGVSELLLRDGLIEAHRYWSELELRERYK